MNYRRVTKYGCSFTNAQKGEDIGWQCIILIYICVWGQINCVKLRDNWEKGQGESCNKGSKSNLGHCDTLTLSSIHGMFTPSAKRLGGPVMWLFKDSFLDTGLEIWSRSHPIDFSGKNRVHIVFLLCHSHKEFLQDDVLEDKLHMLTKISFYHSHQWESPTVLGSNELHVTRLRNLNTKQIIITRNIVSCN